MDIPQIQSKLEDLFSQHLIVFWNDAEGEFESSLENIPTIPGELFAKFQTSFYANPVDAVFRALGVE